MYNLSAVNYYSDVKLTELFNNKLILTTDIRLALWVPEIELYYEQTVQRICVVLG